MGVHPTVTPQRVLFRVDAGSSIGLGHLQRCLSLALALQREGSRCVFLGLPEAVAESIVAGAGFEFIRLKEIQPGDANDLKQVTRQIGLEGYDVAVVDSYQVSTNYLGRLRATGAFVVTLDDLARYPFPCQMVVNGGIHARQLTYRSTGEDTQFLLGTAYCLLRPEFWTVPPRMPREKVRNMLLTLGGADPDHLTPQLLKALDRLPGDFTITVVIGPFFQNERQVALAAQECGHRVQLARSPERVMELMLEADLAVSAAGQTLYELAAVGTPTIAIQVADNQRMQLKSFGETGFLHSAGSSDSDKVVNSAAALAKTLLTSYERRRKMGESGKRLVDGQGALRISRLLLGATANLPLRFS